MSVFAIKDKNTDYIIERVEAPNRRTALAHGRNNIEAVEMSSKEIIETVKAGKAITDLSETPTPPNHDLPLNPPSQDSE